MNVHLAGRSSPDLLALVHLFQERGDTVSHSDQIPPDADVYLFCAGHKAMKQLSRGLVILDFADEPDLETATWTSFADLCLVRDEEGRRTLIESFGCEPERIFVAPDGQAFLNLVDQAIQNTLPPAVVEERGSIAIDQPSISSDLSPAVTEQLVGLTACLEAVARHTDVMLRDYEVRSKLPLVAWIRRNLTSHLREPYLDPTLERQVALNRELVATLSQMLPVLVDLEARLAQLEELQSRD